MRRLQLASLRAGTLEAAIKSGGYLTADSAPAFFLVCLFVLPAVLALCTWPWLRRRPQPQSETQTTNPQAYSRPSGNASKARMPFASAPAPLAPASQDSTSIQGGGGAGDTCHSAQSNDCPSMSARPGQPANPVSLPSQHPQHQQQGADDKAAERQPGMPKAALGPSYESDDECEGPATVEERLNEITRSVKGHANTAGPASANEAARRQAKEAAKRLAAERGLTAAVDAEPKAMATVTVIPVAFEIGCGGAAPDGAAIGASNPAAWAAAGASEAAQTGSAAVLPAPAAAGTTTGGPAAETAPTEGAGEGDGTAAAAASDTYEIDLDIDLTKGDLKVDHSTRGLLGQGGFAAVYKGRYKGQRVAVKMIKKTAGSSLADLQEDMNALVHELHILRQVDHPNIVTLFGGCLKPPHIFLVEERMEGTLDFYVHQVRKHDALSVREVVYFALDIACGLSYLHPRIVHRDLKPANVLLSREGRCKISDFGLARTKMKEYLSTKNLDAGTTAYIAPECFMSMDNPDMHDLRRSVTDRTDIYALAIIMWEMLAGKRPWQGLKPLLVAYQVAYRSLRPPLFELGARCPGKLRQLIEECWCQEPKQRPSSQQAVDRLLEILNELPPEQDIPLDPQQQPAPLLQQQQQRPELVAVTAPAPQQQQLASIRPVALHDIQLLR